MSEVLLGWPYEGRKDASGGSITGGSDERRDVSAAQRYGKDGHLITFAPTGAGKGVRVIIPNLLHYPGSVIVIDPKGENFAVTARYRQEVLGQKIILLDPFERVELDSRWIRPLEIKRAHLSPLEIVKHDEYTIATESTRLAELLGGDSRFSRDPYWEDQGKVLIAGLIAHEIMCAKRQNRVPLIRRVVDAIFPPDGEDTTRELKRIVLEENPIDFAKQSIGSIINIEAPNTRTSVISTSANQLRVLIPKGITDALTNSTISLDDIRERTDYTIYVVIPPNKLISHRPLLRIWVGLILGAVMERSRRTDPSTLFILDECAQLGELNELRGAVTLLRGYGLRVWMFFQDFAQIQQLYERDYMTLVNNCGVLQAFGATRHGAAEPIGKIIGGEETVKQLMALDPQQQLLSITGQGARSMRLMNYLDDKAFHGLFDPNPLHGGSNKQKREAALFPHNHYKLHY